MSEKITLRDGRPTKTVELPSLPGSAVEIWPSLLLRDIKDIDPSESQQKQGIESLPLFIKSWNLTDEAGADLPINKETVATLAVDDAVYLFSQIGEFIAEQKKSS